MTAQWRIALPGGCVAWVERSETREGPPRISLPLNAGYALRPAYGGTP
jgi:hypothetical protein